MSNSDFIIKQVRKMLLNLELEISKMYGMLDYFQDLTPEAKQQNIKILTGATFQPSKNKKSVSADTRTK